MKYGLWNVIGLSVLSDSADIQLSRSKYSTIWRAQRPVTMASSARSSPSDDASVAAVELKSWNGAARVGKFMCVVPPKVRSMGPISLTSTRANDKT